MKTIKQEISNKRISLIVGHYGSGKTEFAVNYVLALNALGQTAAIADLDISNPYFRSRERQDYLEEQGIAVYSNFFHTEITAEIPAITADIRSPLENPSVSTVVDAGGDAAGARILIQFRKYFTGDDCEMLCVINANRPETRDLDGALEHLRGIQEEVGIPIAGLVNNTHMLRETTAKDVLKGQLLCSRLSGRLNIPIRYTCCIEPLIGDFTRLLEEQDEIYQEQVNLFPIHDLKMRETWLDIALRRPHRSPIF